MNIQVECLSDSRDEETPPRRFWLGSRKIEVKTILDRWLGKNYGYFKILAEDGIYILRHDMKYRNWELTFYGES